jgi:hypothetical protein
MHWPYTKDYLDAFMAAQIGAALMLTAVIVYWPMRRTARWLLLVGVWLTAAALQVKPALEDLSFKPSAETFRLVLVACAALGTCAAVASSRPRVVVAAMLGQVPLWLVTGFVKESDADLAALHLAWLGLIAGVLGYGAVPQAPDPPTTDAEGSYLVHDAVAFLAGTGLAAFVCLTVLHRRDGSADEWAYTYQAALFAKGRAYAHVPRCQHFLESFYVFESSGRLFAQYTPGWPMFLVPFMWVRALWLGAPVSMGLLAWGMARLGRSAMRGAWRVGDRPPSARVIRMAGTWAVAFTVLGTTLITNAASRYTHVYVLALYAWSLEALIQVTTPGLSRRRQILWGIVLGTATMQNVAVRPADGAFAGLGIAILFVLALAQRRVGWRALASATLAFGFWAGAVLVILRLQLGRWFETGYSLNALLRPWNTVKFSWPEPNEWKYGLTLASGAYCWWPTSIPLGLAGLARMRGMASELVAAMALSCFPYTLFCIVLDVHQRGFDWGYGPRYLMVLVVPAAVGGAVALAPLTASALKRVTAGHTAISRGAPLALAVFAVVAMWFRIVPPEWATVADHTLKHSAVQRLIETMHLKNAVVLATEKPVGFSEMDLTTNLPLDLYPDQDAIIAIERGEPQEAADCLRSAFPDRQLVRVSGRDQLAVIAPSR